MFSQNFQIYPGTDTENCEHNIPQDNQISTNPDNIRYDLLKVLYAGMLLNFTSDEIRHFWKKHPLPGTDSCTDESKTFVELLHGRSWYSVEYVFSVFNDFENFLIETGKNSWEFIENSFYKINHGLLVSPRSWLSMSKPIFKLFFTEPDFRVLTLNLINHYLQYIAPCFSCKVVSHTSDHEWNTSILIFKYNHQHSSEHCLAADPNVAFPFKINAELWFASLIKKIPQCFSLPRFEHQFMAADCREIFEIVKDVSIKDGLLYINEQIAAEKTSFKSFCEYQGIDTSESGIYEVPVWVMRSDYLCPNRKKVVLHQGCAYGAPVCLFGFHYLKLNQSPANFLDSIIDDIVNFNDFRWSEIKEIHNKLIKQLTCCNNFTYDRKNETIQLNGIEFIKNVPAKILRKILHIYVETGRTEFFHSEFAKDSSIIDNPYQPNFAVRLKRLMNTFENSNTSISIQKLNKGTFIFHSACKISLDEIN